MKPKFSAHYSLKKNKGFSLIEIAFILVALGIFVTISAIAIQSLTRSGKTEQNRKILAEYDRSVRGFLASNYRIVCPDADDDGIEDFSDNGSGMTHCADYTGYLPYQTLGLPSGNDAWGNIVRFSIYEPESEVTTCGLVINELRYAATDYHHEFLELYNSSGSAIDLSGYQLTDDITLTFPDNTTIAADEYIVCARYSDDPIWDSVSYQVFEHSLSLSSTGNTINLLDKDSNTVDTITTDNDAPWPVDGVDGFDEEIHSIELIDPCKDNDNGSNWSASTVAGGTPGQENSVYVPDTGAEDISDGPGLCTFLNTQPKDYDIGNKIYVDNATGAFHHRAYILVSGGPKDLDDQGGFFDGYNGKSPEIRFESPDKISDSDYDDFVTAVSFEELYSEICTSSGEVK